MSPATTPPRALRPEDHAAVADLLTAAFPTEAEARLVEALRASGDMAVELVTEVDGRIVGHIAFSRHRRPEGWVCLAPLAVAEEHRQQGIGAELVRMGLDHVRGAQVGAVSVLGEARYYQRFGFTRHAAEHLETPFPIEHTLLYPIETGSGGRKARLVYAAPFMDL